MSLTLDQATRETRFCRVLVLSKRLRSNGHSDEYKPFNVKPLLQLFEEVAQDVQLRHKSPLFEKHVLYNNFYFGARTVAREVIAELRDLPSSIIDCDALAGGDPEDVAAASEALKQFIYDNEKLKTLVFVCRDHCDRMPPHNHQPAFSDEDLFQALWNDLTGNLYAFVGRYWAKYHA